MDSVLSILGLGPNPPSKAPYYISANFVFAYILLSPRALKILRGIDNNVAPREDLQKYGDRAVQEGKITRQELNALKRQEAAHANAMENFPLLVASLLSAQAAGVPNEVINSVALTYTAVRAAYAVSYVVIDKKVYSWARSVLWYTGNITCLRLLWKAGELYQKSS